MPRMNDINPNHNDTILDPTPDRNDILDSTSLNSLSEDDREKLLRNIGYLYGVRTEKIDGPTRSTRPVAKRRPGGPPCLREMHDVITEVINTWTERNSNFIHQGWSLAAALDISPWTVSRDAHNTQPNHNWAQITKRTIVQRLNFCLSLEELIPEPAFVADIEAALEKPTTYEKFQAVYQALHIWGDVVPLEFDVGISLTVTDTEANMAGLPAQGAYDSFGGWLNVKSARVTKKGGDVKSSTWSDGRDLARDVPPLQWSQVRVTRVSHTIDLLEDSLRRRLAQLHGERLSYCTSSILRIMDGYKSYDDTNYASKSIAYVTIRCQYHIDSLSLTYRDNSTTDRHGGEAGDLHKFSLMTGEYITDMMLWSDREWVYGLQLFTNMGRASPHYGGSTGTPRAAKSVGGALVGFSSTVRNHPRWNHDMIVWVQGIWCHDRIGTTPRGEDVFSEYFGGEAGTPFNDRIVVGNSSSMYISEVVVWCGDIIDSIQLKYAENKNGQPSTHESMRHGGGGGGQKRFTLESGEHIVAVSGGYDNNQITRLCFVTNLGRTSDVFGGGRGRSFSISAPRYGGRGMRLQYICGKRQVWLL